VAVRRLATLHIALAPLAVLALALTGCDDSATDGDVTSFAVILPAGLAEDIVLIRLAVLDEDASCEGDSAVGGMALTGLGEIEIGPSDSQSLMITPGQRTFSAKGFDAGDLEIATGCTSLDLADDRNVRISMVRTAGFADAGPPDATGIDAGAAQ
jgi:hypothetical protein